MICRFGRPQNDNSDGQSMSRCSRQTRNSGTRWSTSEVFHSRPPVSAHLRALQAADQLGVVARRVPQPPRRDAGGVPGGILVRPALPQVLVPAEPIDRLAAHAAEARSARESLLAERRGRRAEAHRQIALAPFFQPPGPAVRRAAAARERARQPVGAQRMRAPVAVDREPRHRRRPAPVERIGQHRRREDLRQRLGQPRERALRSPGRVSRTSSWGVAAARIRPR